MARQGRRGLRAGAPRDLRTVLFTDIVGSTEVAARLGDRAYGEGFEDDWVLSSVRCAPRG